MYHTYAKSLKLTEKHVMHALHHNLDWAYHSSNSSNIVSHVYLVAILTSKPCHTLRGGARGLGGGGSTPLILVKKLCQNDYIFFFFVLRLQCKLILGHVIHHWKDVFKTFPEIYYKPLNSKKLN
jgi:hypothetical protein